MNNVSLARLRNNERLVKALTGLTWNEFAILLESFKILLHISFLRLDRERAVGGGRIGALVDAASKLFFILFYLKVYPTYDVASFIFGVDRSRTCRWVQQLLPMIEKALGRNASLPKRRINSVKELLDSFPGIQDIFIDGAERRVQRPKKSKLQKRRYSGKKKMHTRKNTIITDDRRKILVVSSTQDGKMHDLTQLGKSNVLEHVPGDIDMWVDKGYYGIQKYLQNDNQVFIPHKKPKGKELTTEQKKENAAISAIRVVVEHAIGGIKRFGAMACIYRNRKGQDDTMIAVCSGLWNFHIQYA